MRGDNAFGNLSPQVGAQNTPSALGVNDIILHSAFVRLALSDNSVVEFRTTYDKATDTVDLDIPASPLAYFEQLTGMQRGDNFKTFMNWLIGSSTLTVGSSSLDNDPNFISSSAMDSWTGASVANFDDEMIVLTLPAAALSVVGHNFKAGRSGTLNASLVWLYDSGNNNNFDVRASLSVTDSNGATVVSSDDTSISTVNLISGDIRTTSIISDDVEEGDVVGLMISRNYAGSTEPSTDLVCVVGVLLEIT